jgi:hypothetical protein
MVVVDDGQVDDRVNGRVDDQENDQADGQEYVDVVAAVEEEGVADADEDADDGPDGRQRGHYR